jgi:hypothetical protein
MGDMGEVWEGHREAQQARRAARLPGRTQEILDLKGDGFDVVALSPYQFRVDGRLDLYPIHRRYHDTRLNRRGGYQTAKAIAVRVLWGSTT